MPSQKKTAITCRGYPLAAADRQELQKQVKELLAKGFIRGSRQRSNPRCYVPPFLFPSMTVANALKLIIQSSTVLSPLAHYPCH